MRQLACRASKAEPKSLKMYTFKTSHYDILSLSEDDCLTIRKKRHTKKEIRASKNKLRASEPKPQFAQGQAENLFFVVP